MKYNPFILARVRTRLENRGVDYVREDSKTLKRGQILYAVFFGYTVLMLLFYLIGQSLQLDRLNSLEDPSQYQISSIQNSMTLAWIAVGAYVAGIVFVFLKRGLLQLILTAVPSVALTIEFIRIYQAANGIQASFYFRHLIPMAVLTIVSVWIFLALFKARRIESKAYTHMVEALYQQFGGGMEQMSDAEWESFLQSYQGPKPSERRTKKKKERKSDPSEPNESEE